MEQHRVRCNSCKKYAPLESNGEHWLLPEGWVVFYTSFKAEYTDEHLCPDCKTFICSGKPYKRAS